MFHASRERWICPFLAVTTFLTLVPGASAQRRPMLAVTMPAQESVNLFEIDGSRLTLKKAVQVGKAPGRMCADPAGTTLFVAAAGGVAAVDLRTLTVSAGMTDGAIKSLFGCVVSPDGKKL